MVFRHDWGHLKPMLAIRRGAPEGRRAYLPAEREAFVQRALAAVKILRTTKASIKKTDLARRLFERHANPLRELNRRLKKYQNRFSETDPLTKYFKWNLMVTKNCPSQVYDPDARNGECSLILRSDFRYEFLRDRYARFVLVFD